MRKVKFTQDVFDEKIGRIITEFPILDVSIPLSRTQMSTNPDQTLTEMLLSSPITRTSTHSYPPY